MTSIKRAILSVSSLLAGLLVLGCLSTLRAQTTVALMPVPKPSFYGQNGQPLAGCKIYTYITGTGTPQGTFFDSAGTVPNSNPVICDAGGFASIWLIVGDTYRIVVQDQNGVQQYIVDGVVGIGGGTLSLFSTPNTWTALQTFSGGASINGGTLTGTFTGSPAFSGTPQFTTFTISNSTVIANLNASLWNGTSVTPAGGALTNNFVPVITGGAAATWQAITNSMLPGSGVTTVGPTTCTLGSSCAAFIPAVFYSTPSASTNANIPATTMVTVGGSNANYRFNWYVNTTVLGASCTGNTTLVVHIDYTDPAGAGVGAPDLSKNANGEYILALGGNGTLGGGYNVQGGAGATFSFPFRAAAGTLIQYDVTYTAGTGCAPGPKFQIFPILEQLSLN